VSSSKYPRYESYKDSGVEWLGEMPASWDVKRLKTIAALVTSKAVSADYPVALENIEGWTGRFLPTDTEFQAEGTAFRKGDVLFGKLRPYLAKVWLADRSGEAVGDIFTLRPKKETYGQYLRSVLVTPEIIKMLDGSTFGSKMPRVSWDFMSTLRLPVPPVGEQESIAAFLDRETAKIDNLIAKQGRLIELLTEKRQAAITQAVTKGLDPSVPMKDSNVEWLGELPQSWELKCLRHLAKIETGSRDTSDALDEGDFPFFVRSETVEKIDTYSYDCEAVLTAGDGVGVGKVFHHFNGKFEAHQRVYVFHSFKEISGRFLYYYLKALFYRVALEGGAKSTVDSLRRPMLTTFPVCVPSLVMQNEITAFLDDETAKIDTLIEKSKRAIELQKEHRASLISAAVTGKIDVRGLA